MTDNITHFEWERITAANAVCLTDAYYAKRPPWIAGSISHYDARFLFRRAIEIQTTLAVEIGTASGFSTGLLCYALACAAQAGLISDDFHVVTYDINRRFYADKSRDVGEAAREQLPPPLLTHVTFESPATSLKLRERFGRDEIKFMFIDANHRHPWPALDLLAALDHLGAGAEVVLHDINLPIRHPEFAAWGAKFVFDGLDVEKRVAESKDVPNIGSITIPEGKEAVREQLRRIVFDYTWEVEVGDEVKAALLA